MFPDVHFGTQYRLGGLRIPGSPDHVNNLNRCLGGECCLLFQG
jgi:hypothetical protein